MKVVVTGGGTGGHIYPMATIARYLRDEKEVEILYIGSDDDFFPDKRLATYFDLPFQGISSRGMEGGRPLDFVWKNVKGINQAKKILRSFQPDLVFSTGGFVSFPVVVAAGKLGIPYVLHEQNTVVGKVNRLARKKATKLLHTFPVCNSEKEVVTGNPVRFTEALEREGKHVVFLGGSGGSLALNEAGVQFAAKHPDIPVIIQTGKGLYEKTAYLAKQTPSPQLTLVPYKDDLLELYREAKCIVTRSGSGSLFEIANLGIPSIFVPLPNSADDHQKKNALYFAQENAAIMVEQDAHFQTVLEEQLLTLWEHPEKRAHMRKRLATLAVRNSVERIVEELELTANKK